MQVQKPGGRAWRAPAGIRAAASAAAIFALVAAAASFAGDKPPLAGTDDKINYSVGYQVGGDFKRQGVSLNADALAQGVRDAIAGTEPMLSQKEMILVLTDLKKKITASERKDRQERLATDLAADKEFLAANAKKEGVVTLPSGLQYKVLKEGNGKTPSQADNVIVQYRSLLVDGTEFDSSYRRGQPATLAVVSVVPGWREALLKMKEGASWQIALPAALAYGERGPLEGRAVVVDLELISVVPGK